MVNLPLGPGCFVAIVGPSGAGKDSVIDYARRQLCERDDIVFVQRVVTRPMDPASEVHDSLTPEDFEKAQSAGRFALAWAAHGHHYGLPREIDASVLDGRTVVANVSRQILPEMRERYIHTHVVAISARPEIIAERLIARGREDRDAVMARMQRGDIPVTGDDVIHIDNSGALADAGAALVEALLHTLPQNRNP